MAKRTQSKSETYHAPQSGLRVGGKYYQPGQRIPAKYGRMLKDGQVSVDPALMKGAETPPNFGRLVIPQVFTFAGRTSTVANVYRNYDEAVKASVDNARFMRNDCSIMECLEARQRAVALLNWHIEPDDKKDPQQVKMADEMTKVLAATPGFTEYRRNLLEAIWYGRYAVQHAYGRMHRNGRKYVVISDWEPINGDKLVFGFDDETGRYEKNRVGIKVTPAFRMADPIAGDRELNVTEQGNVYFLESWERSRVAIHKHIIEDGVFEDPLSAGRVNGVGIRDRIYWTWYQKQETMAHMMEIIERTGSGFTIYWYPAGDAKAKQEVEQIAQEGNRSNVLIMPRQPGDDSEYGVDRVEPNSSGVEIMRQVISEFFGHQIKRYILGQILSSESAGTGLGSGVADLHKDTFAQIIQYDAVKLEETITNEVLEPLKRFNFQTGWDVPLYFKIDTESADSEKKMAAYRQAWDMGAALKASDIMDIIGASMPTSDDAVLVNPAVVQQNRLWQQNGGQGAPAGSIMKAADLFGDALDDGTGQQEQGHEQPQDGQQPQRYAKQDEIRTADDWIHGQIKRINTGKATDLNLGRVRDFWPRSKEVSGKSANAEVIYRSDFRGTVYCYPTRIVIGRGAVNMAGDRTRALGSLLLDAARELTRSYGGVAKYAKALSYSEITAVANETEGPSEAQKEAGNYAKGKFRWNGLPITIENAAGTKRNPEWKPLAHHYGYINRTESKDGDQVDVFIGPNPESDVVFVVDQVTAAGRFDEHKCMLGFTNKADAIKGYLANYDDGWKLGPVTPMTVEQFKAWLADGDTKKPVAAQVSKYAKQMTLWEEKEHPRNDSGEFTSKGEGSSSKPSSQPDYSAEDGHRNTLATKAKAGDKQSRNDLITAYMPLIKSIVSKKVRGKRGNFDDIVQEASIAVNHAVDKWEPSKGPFHAYASMAIRNAAEGVNRKESKHDKRSIGQESDDFNANDLPDRESGMDYDQFDEDSKWAQQVLKELPEKWQAVVNGRMDAVQMRVLADELKLSTGRIGQIYEQAINRLREMHPDKDEVIGRYFRVGIRVRYAALPVPGNAAEASHQVGETTTRNGVTYRLNQNHRWELANQEEKPAGDKGQTSTTVDTEAFAAKSLGTVSHPLLAQTLGAFHGKDKGGLSGKKVRSVLQEALQSGGEGQGPQVDLGNGQTAQAVKAHGGLVVDLGNGRIGFASSAGSIVIHQAVDGQAKLTYAHNTGLVRDAMKKGQADTQEQPASTTPPESEQQPAAETTDAPMPAPSQQTPPVQDGPKQRWRIPKGGLAGDKPAEKPVEAKQSPQEAPVEHPKAEEKPLIEQAAEALKSRGKGDKFFGDRLSPAPEPTEPKQPPSPTPAHMALRHEANKAHAKVDKLTADYAAGLQKGLTKQQDMWHRLTINAHRKLANHAEGRAKEAEKAHAANQKAKAIEQKAKAKESSAAEKAEAKKARDSAKQEQQLTREKLKTQGLKDRLEAAKARNDAKAKAAQEKRDARQANRTTKPSDVPSESKDRSLLDSAEKSPGGGYKDLDPTDPNYRKSLGDKLKEHKEKLGRQSMIDNVDKHLTEAGLQPTDQNKELVKRALALSDNENMEGYIRDSGQLKNMLAKAKSLHQQGHDEHEALKQAVDSRSHLKPRVNVDKVMAENADAWGMSPDEYRDIANDVWKLHGEHQANREAAKKTARGLIGLNSSHLKGSDGDYASGSMKGKNWDVYADEVARQHPELGWQPGDHQNEQRLWDLIQEGSNPLPQPHEDAYHDAVHNHLAELYGDSDEYRKWRLSGGHQEQVPDYEPSFEGAIPFAKSGLLVRYQAMCRKHLEVIANSQTLTKSLRSA